MSSEPSPTGPFTGRRRDLKSRWSVRAADAVARAVITVGGLGTIVAVSLVAVYLCVVALPLFFPGRITPRPGGPGPAAPPLLFALDDAGELAWSVGADGVLSVLHLAPEGPHLLDARTPFPNKSLAAAVSPPGESGAAAFAFADGTARVARLRFTAATVAEKDVPTALRGLAPGAAAGDGPRLLRRLADGRWEARELKVEWSADLDLGLSAGVLALDYSPAANEKAENEFLAALGIDGTVRLVRLSRSGLRKRTDRTSVDTAVTLAGPAGTGEADRPARVFVGGDGEAVYSLRSDGRLSRWNTFVLGQPKFAEDARVVEAGRTVTAAGWLAGKGTLLVGDSAGGLSAWFRVPAGPDSDRLIAGHRLPGPGGPVAALTAAPRRRLAAAADADGRLAVVQVTAESLIVRAELPARSAPAVLAFAPGEDTLAAAGPGVLALWSFDARHAEATPRALFGPVWYEGYPAPGHTWQPNAAEPKYGFLPLVFGTLKATFYAMLIAAPLAFLAAIFTSEFLGPRGRGLVKPAVEVMAGLPSVVLGLVGALVIGPLLGAALPSVVLGIAFVPVMLVIGGQLWELVPHRLRASLGAARLAGLLAAVGLAGVLGWLLGPAVEGWLFAGDVRRWLAAPAGPRAFGGWVVAILPVSLAASAAAFSWYLAPAVRSWAGPLPQARSALLGLWLTLGALLAGVGLGLGVAATLAAAGLDVRGSAVGDYSDRNALLVGLMLGFAVIPIVYTIADDALRAVPEHLRAASLACGATPWQTAVRVVVPTALSGLFAALMVGLGRAVGETMIALLCLGRTPIIDVNPFNGATSLSITIASEMAEAPRGETHYRALFLAGLVLFALTFVVNTAAEAVRLQFRKRAQQL